MTKDLEFQSLEGYDYKAAPVVMLRDAGGRDVVGMWGRKLFDYVNGELVELTASVMQWGALVDGDFHPMRNFEPVEFAPMSFEDTAALALA